MVYTGYIFIHLFCDSQKYKGENYFRLFILRKYFTFSRTEYSRIDNIEVLSNSYLLDIDAPYNDHPKLRHPPPSCFSISVQMGSLNDTFI